MITSFLFDTLVWKNENATIPWLAEGWEAKENGTTWIFHLRRGTYWHDGAELTADDVVFTIKYMLKHGWHWKNINPDLIEDVEAPDNYTVIIRLKKPYIFFLEDYASTIFILPRHVWSRVADPYSYKGADALIGSGPYKLKSYQPEKAYVLDAFQDYWAGRPAYDEIVILASGLFSPQRAAEALLSGEADTAVFVGKAWRLVKQLQGRVKGLKVEKGPMYWVLYLDFNHKRWPTNSTVFRRAVAYALNLTELVMKAVGSLDAALPGSPGYIPPYSWFYNPNVPRYPYDPAMAKELLDRLGIIDSNGDGYREAPDGKPLRLRIVTLRSYVQEATIVKEQLARVGLCVDVKAVASYSELDAIVSREMYDLQINGHGAVGNTPTAFAWYFTGRFGTPWVNETYKRLVDQLLSAQSVEEARRAANELQRVIAEQLPRIALYYPYIYVVSRPGSPDWFFTAGGIDGGIPLPYNKLALLERRD
ncbi:ABC transporter substrate-binding protein [Pyrodictium abyssi]|uniref:ABC transporter substrate-binding protein n=1 Tax=Pyrodictium abyssi TaxID=54256 RepID=A0ABM8IYZ6_9CREN|nr:ABC transporter substrate-binding protein [Pyrodictium abyssi]